MVTTAEPIPALHDNGSFLRSQFQKSNRYKESRRLPIHNRCAIKVLWDLGKSRKGHNFAATKLMLLTNVMWRRLGNMLASGDFLFSQPISGSTIVRRRLCRSIRQSIP
jgi:hypothetical protein